MKNKYTIKNMGILALSALGVVMVAVLPFLLSAHVVAILRGCTGWVTFALLGSSLITYTILSEEEKMLRIFTILMLVFLTGGYFLYLVFGLEAYKFACSALIFDVGTSLVAINIFMRIGIKINQWQLKKTLSDKK